MRIKQHLFLLLTALFLLTVPARSQQQSIKGILPFQNFHQVSDSIYRSEQPDSAGIVFLQENEFKSILNLKTKQSDSAFNTEDMHLYHVRMKAECIRDKEVIEALKVLRDAPKPLLIHCRSGSDRTGLIIALYRILYQNYTKSEALEEMKNGGYGFHRIFFNIPRYLKKVDIAALKRELQ